MVLRKLGLQRSLLVVLLVEFRDCKPLLLCTSVFIYFFLGGGGGGGVGGWALIRGWALINFPYLQGGCLFEVGAYSRLGV